MRKQFTKQYKFEKNSRKINKLYFNSYKEIRNEPYRDIEPFQRGWVIYITLRDDILRRKDADFLLELLELGYHKKLPTREVNYIRNVRKGIYYYHDRGWGTNLIPKRVHITPKQYSEFTEKVKKYFTQYEKYGKIYYKIIIPYYWIKLKTKPNMITKVQDINPELHSKYKKLRNTLINKYWWRGKGQGKRNMYWRFHKTRAYTKAQNYKHVQQELLLDNPDEYDYLFEKFIKEHPKQIKEQ